jgi:outer membrane protein OmpA-like peptidoglycan-associated protein
LIDGDTTTASLFVDDVMLTDTTSMFVVEANSSYVVRIEKEGYKTIKQTLRIPAGTRTAHLHKSYKLAATKPQLNLRIVNDIDSLIKGSLLQLYDGKTRKVVYQGKLEEGLYHMELEYDRKYMYKALAPRHFYHQGELDLIGINYGKIINEDAVLTPIEVGAKITINSILFETASAELTENDKNELKNVINVLAQNKNIIVEISAHTDDVGSDGNNLKLSEARAQAVMDHLISQKVPSRMLTSKGYGESQPVVPNTSEASRAQNRRVEFRVSAVK